jgi:alpha-L-rhamnosidase
MAKVGGLLGRSQDAATYRALADDILRVFIAKYWDPTTHSFQKPPLGNIQTENAMALVYDMVPGSDLRASDPRHLAGEPAQAENERSVAAVIANDVISRGNHFGSGIYGLRYLFDILNDYGYKDVAYSMVTQVTNPSWGHLIAIGNTALTEGWGRPTGNHHYFSSVLNWYYQDALGIRPTAPGYATVRIKPYVPTVEGTSSVPPFTDENPEVRSLLDDVEGSIRTARGTIGSSWSRRDDGRIQLTVAVPSNTPAEVWVPTMARPVDAPRDADFVRFEGAGSDQYAVYQVLPGTHTFNR